MITLNLTDDNPGLQVKVDDEKWINIPPRKGTFVVNIGDMFERWTNGIFKSTVHRVITLKGANERYSVPFFLNRILMPSLNALRVAVARIIQPSIHPSQLVGTY